MSDVASSPDYGAGPLDPHLVQVEKVHEGAWNRAIFDFLRKYRASMMPPYPSTVALLRTGDRGHAEAYARAIRQHVEKHVAGGYLVTVFGMCEIEPATPLPPGSDQGPR